MPAAAKYAVLVAFICVGAAAAAAAKGGDYTSDQASAGQAVYNASCASCHGGKLGGGAGPALEGSAFAQSLQFSKMSATQLFDFISTHMPADDPGSLSQDKYIDVMAYLLSQNGYPAGDGKLSPDSLKKVELLPYPKK